MKFLANENVPLASIRHLRHNQCDVYSLIENSPGITDEEVLSIASSSNRVVLTFDRDYGELVYRQKLPCPPGVIYFRFDPAYPRELAEIFLRILGNAGVDLLGKFTVVERKNIRQRPLPSRG